MDAPRACPIHKAVEPSCDRVWVHHPTVLEAHEPAVVRVVVPERSTFLVDHLDVCAQRRNGERVERDGSPTALALSVGVHGLASDDDASVFDGERAAFQVEHVTTCPG